MSAVKHVISLMAIVLSALSLSLTTLSAEDGSVRFALMADLHYSEGSRSVVDLRKCIRDINTRDNLDFVMVAGDLTDFGLQELGPHTKKASGIINLGVVGGATLPLLMGWIVDNPALGVGYAVAMMFIYYVYVFWFCNFGSKIGLSKK